MFKRFIHTNGDPLLTALRIALAIVFLASGTPPLTVLEIAAQFFGGIALLLGLLTRLAAFGIALDLVLALITVRLPFDSFVNGSEPATWAGFEYHLLVLAVAGALIVRGAGACSVDRLLSHESPASRSASPAPNPYLDNASFPGIEDSTTQISTGPSAGVRFMHSGELLTK
jgi:putative oxidoreductase